MDNTKIALKNLQEQMVNDWEETNNNNNTSNENEDINDESDEDDNLIIKNFQDRFNITATATPKNLKNQKDEISTVLSTLLVQHELDRNRISKMVKKQYRLEMENEKQDMKLHYMRLEFSNANIDLDETKTKLKQSQDSIELLGKNKLKYNAYILVYVMFTIFYAYFF